MLFFFLGRVGKKAWLLLAKGHPPAVLAAAAGASPHGSCLPAAVPLLPARGCSPCPGWAVPRAGAGCVPGDPREGLEAAAEPGPLWWWGEGVCACVCALPACARGETGDTQELCQGVHRSTKTPFPVGDAQWECEKPALVPPGWLGRGRAKLWSWVAARRKRVMKEQVSELGSVSKVGRAEGALGRGLAQP